MDKQLTTEIEVCFHFQETQYLYHVCWRSQKFRAGLASSAEDIAFRIFPSKVLSYTLLHHRYTAIEMSRQIL